MTAVASPVRFPPRQRVADVFVSCATYADTTEAIMAAARVGRSAQVSATAAHAVTLAALDPDFRMQLNRFDALAPDGQPVRWALNLLHGARLSDRVYGPTLMLRVCEAAAREGLAIYLYGSRPEVVSRLAMRLGSIVPGLRIAGYRASRFRPSSAAEDADDVADILRSGARIVFVGLGCPRQERWAYQHRDRLPMPLVCVGAAFDFHAGTLRQAPAWMQVRGLEWLFRLAIEPRRLASRYVKYNPIFVWLVARQYLTGGRWRTLLRRDPAWVTHLSGAGGPGTERGSPRD